MSKVPAIADDIRLWLEGSRTDAFSIHLQEFENADKKGYMVLVWATNIKGKLVAKLSFKIAYPWLKIYRCYVLPEARGNLLTCQMYMVPMAFATEDLNIKMVKAKELDPNLVDRFAFNAQGFLSLRKPSERDALQDTMENCYAACAQMQKCFKSNLGKSQLLIITDKANDPRWSNMEGLNPISFGGNPVGGRAFGFPVDEEESYREFIDKGYGFPRVLWDVQRALDPKVLSTAADAVKGAVERWGGQVYVNTESQLGHHLEARTMVKEKTCTNSRCHERKCENNVCYDVYSLQLEE
jgi:hypothetical protein